MFWGNARKGNLTMAGEFKEGVIIACRWTGISSHVQPHQKAHALVEDSLLPSRLTLNWIQELLMSSFKKNIPACLQDFPALVWMMMKLAVVKMQAPAGERNTETATVCCQRLFLILIWLLSLATPAPSIHMESTESHSEFSCEPIRLRMCQDLPYNTTFMPNLLNHYDQQTAALAMEVGCSYTSCSHCMLCVRVCILQNMEEICCFVGRDKDRVTCSLLQNKAT